MLNTYNNHKDILTALNEVTDIVKQTYGINGINLSRYDETAMQGKYKGEAVSFDDGYSALLSIKGDTIAEKIALTMLQSTASQVSSVVGDGTTTSCLILQSLYKNVNFSDNSKLYKQKQNLILSRKNFNEIIKKYTKKITLDDTNKLNTLCESIAKNKEVSTNVLSIFKETMGDANVIPYMMIGQPNDKYFVDRGIVLENLLESDNITTSSETEIVQNCGVILTNITVQNLEQNCDFNNLIKRADEEKLPGIVFFANYFSSNAINDVVTYNAMARQNKLPCFYPVIINTRGYLADVMNDLSSALGITKLSGNSIVEGWFNQEDGYQFRVSHLKHTEISVCNVSINYKKDGSGVLTIKDANSNKDLVKKSLEYIKNKQENLSHKNEKEVLSYRKSILTGVFVSLTVCGSTAGEISEKWERYDDTIKGLKSALEDGYIEGAGKIWLDILESETLDKYQKDICKDIISALKETNSFQDDKLECVAYDTFNSIAYGIDIAYSNVIAHIVPNYLLT